MLPRKIFHTIMLTLTVITLLSDLAPAQVVSTPPIERLELFDDLTYDPAIPTPASVLGYEVGSHFTRHADLMHYLQLLARSSDRARMVRYGQSYQRRDLYTLTISSPANMQRLDEILKANRELADPATSEARVQEIVQNNPAIAWFSYGVHGNEPSTSECSLRVAYTMTAATSPPIMRLLDDVVLVVDPLLNPDGHERYVSWYQNTVGRMPLVNPDASEHHEPWPGGRTNHYYFDLNRDWLWLIHPESRQRLQVYRQYLPHLHIDFHEQGYTRPFFFGAGDSPYHTLIPESTREWVELYGKANAVDFDRHGLVYSTAERFDYLYPGYGKVLPVYHGAVGMLAEKGGHSRAGLAIDVGGLYVLTLAERTEHHYLLSMSNLQATADNRRGQLERFREFFLPQRFQEELSAQTFVIDRGNDSGQLQELWSLCDGHGIEVHTLQETTQIDGLHDYRSGEAIGQRQAAAGSWVIRTDQPMGRLATAILERQTEVVDPDTYDITGWSVPIAFGLEAWYAKDLLNLPIERLTDWRPPAGQISGRGDVAVLIDAGQYRFPIAAGLATSMEIPSRIAGEPFVIDGRSFSRGSMIIHLRHTEPESMTRFLQTLVEQGLRAHRVATGMTQEGPVLGAFVNEQFIPPKTLLLRGEPTSSYSYGQLWFQLDVASPIPYTPLNVSSFKGIDLDDYNLIVIPDAGGDLKSALGGDSQMQRIDRWVREGGTVVGLGRAALWVSANILSLETKAKDGETLPPRPVASKLTHQERADRNVEDRVSGSVLSATIDTSHPLAAGVAPWVGVIKRSASTLPVSDSGSVVARWDEQPQISGVISERNLKRIGETPMMTHHNHGRGVVICLSEDVSFRGFQHGPLRLLFNAVIFGPTLGR